MKNKILQVKADIHPDGDIYIEKDGTMHLIGCISDIEDNFVSGIPNKAYLNAKKLLIK